MIKTSSLRRRTMQAVKSRDTAPEMAVRRTLHAMGYRYRLHLGDLPGKPDVVFPGRRKVIFVHGCFWHGHPCARGNRVPKTNAEYWKNKIQKNRERYSRQLVELNEGGWTVLTVWECEVRHECDLAAQLVAFLDDGHPAA